MSPSIIVILPNAGYWQMPPGAGRIASREALLFSSYG
jgi:hypothetical protein